MNICKIREVWVYFWGLYLRPKGPYTQNPIPMPRKVLPLSATQVEKAKGKETTYTLFDGGGLYLEVSPLQLTPEGKPLPVSKRWRMKYRFEGKSCLTSFGAYPAVSLEQAREKRRKVREMLALGIRPTEERRRTTTQDDAASTDQRAFRDVAQEWYDVTEDQWAPSYARTIKQRLENDVHPMLGDRPISSIKPADILAVLRMIEGRGAIESAHRVRMHISQVYDYAITIGLVEINPALRLGKALKRPDTRHMAAVLDIQELGRLMRDIEGYQGAFQTRCALRLAPLLFVRPGELRAMTWAELDLDAALWSIPGERMKMSHAHLVPLCRQAMEILTELRPLTGHHAYVFAGRTGKRPMSNNTINAALRYLGWDKDAVTGHGFRATARTLLDEVLGCRVDLIEHQLAHKVKDPNGRAYNRTSFLADRREMMQTWADYLDGLR